MPSTPKIRWLDEPEEKDYLAAESFLSMVLAPASLSEVVASLHTAPTGHWAAKDILRAAGLPPLKPKQSAEVAEKLKKIKDGIPISPILLIGGIRDYLVIGDGYHRASAAYWVDEDALVPGRLLWSS
jgi:ABC-type glycerol-3-phosphate transport system substrate-binding protein